MKKGLFYILTCMIVFALSGCGSRESPLTAADIIKRSLIQVSDAKSIEFTLSVVEYKGCVQTTNLIRLAGKYQQG